MMLSNTIRLMLGMEPVAPPRPFVPTRPFHRAETPQPFAPEVELHRRVLALPVRPKKAWERWLAGNGEEPSLASFEAFQLDYHYRARTFPCRFTAVAYSPDALPELSARDAASFASWCLREGSPMDRHALAAWKADEAVTQRLLPAKVLAGGGTR
ncbi:MAG: hypothetical protein ACK4F5_17140 [Aliihoeflea sp.]